MQVSTPAGSAGLIAAGRAPTPTILSKRNLVWAAVAAVVSVGLLTYAANSGATLADPKPSARFYEIVMVLGALVLLAIGAVLWIVILNIAFLTTTILPIMAMRWLAGPSIAALP